MDQAVVLHALERVDRQLRAAAGQGRAAEAYLRLAAPRQQDRAAALVLVAMLRRGRAVVPSAVVAAVTRWEALMAQELGDPVRARVVRLVGDGLFVESLVSGEPPAPALLDQLGTSSATRLQPLLRRLHDRFGTAAEVPASWRTAVGYLVAGGARGLRGGVGLSGWRQET